MEGGNVSDIASNTLKDVGVKDTRAARKMAMKKDGIVDVSNMLGGFIQDLPENAMTTGSKIIKEYENKKEENEKP